MSAVTNSKGFKVASSYSTFSSDLYQDLSNLMCKKGNSIDKVESELLEITRKEDLLKKVYGIYVAGLDKKKNYLSNELYGRCSLGFDKALAHLKARTKKSKVRQTALDDFYKMGQRSLWGNYAYTCVPKEILDAIAKKRGRVSIESYQIERNELIFFTDFDLTQEDYSKNKMPYSRGKYKVEKPSNCWLLRYHPHQVEKNYYIRACDNAATRLKTLYIQEQKKLEKRKAECEIIRHYYLDEWLVEQKECRMLLKEIDDLFGRGKFKVLEEKLDGLSKKIVLYENKPHFPGEKFFSKNEINKVHSLWMMTKLILIIDSHKKVSKELAYDCIEKTSTVTHFQLSYTLGMIALKQGEISAKKLGGTIYKKLTWLAQNSIVNDQQLAFLQIIINRAHNAGLLTDIQKRELKNKATREAILSDPRIKRISEQTYHLQKQFQSAAYYFTQKIQNIEDNIRINKENISGIAGHLQQLQEAIKLKSERELTFNTLKLGLSIVGVFGLDYLRTVVDISDFSQLGSFLLNKPVEEVEKSLSTPAEFLQQVKAGHIKPIAGEIIKKAGYDPNVLINKWCETALVLKSKESNKIYGKHNLSIKPTSHDSTKNMPQHRAFIAQKMTAVNVDSKSKFAKMLFDYNGEDSTELSVPQGKRVEVLKMSGSGWWYCSYNSERGFLPSNYLELVIPPNKALPKLPTKSIASNQSICSSSSSPQIQNNCLFASKKSASYKVTSDRKAVVLYPFDTNNPKELSVSQGQLVDVINDTDSRRWLCELNSKRGYLPATYLQEIFQQSNTLQLN